MSDQIMRRFKVQLTTAMDSVLRSAVFEVMTIFENTLHDHQMEMAQKGEEVAQLKIKLQAVELRLKDLNSSGPTRVQTTQTQTESKVALDAPKPTSEVPEIDVEVPDDWCAPLGCEVVTKEEDAACPSVRLRQLTIPLWHIPIREHKVLNSDIDPNCTIGSRRTQRISALNAKSKLIQGGKRTVTGLGSQCMPIRNDMKRLMQDMKWVYSDLSGSGGLRSRKMRKNLKQKQQENPAEQKEERSKSTSVKSKSDKVTKVGKKTYKYPCKFCSEVFDTEFGRSTHVHCHKKCEGCNKIFSFPSNLKIHKQRCPKLKNLLLKNPSDTSNSSSDEESVPCKTQSIREVSTQSSDNVRETSTKESSSDVAEHMQCHFPKLCYTCNICLMKFTCSQALGMHVAKKHRNHTSSIDVNRSLEWAKPLENINDGGENSVSLREGTSQKIRIDKTFYKDWRKVGARCREGFSCIVCQKILKNKMTLIEHFRIHTGEKPFGCKMCSARFRYRAALYSHQKKLHQFKY